MKYILAYNEDLTFKGFFVEGIHSDIPSPNLSINKELWSYLVSLNSFILKPELLELEKEEFTLEDKDLFEEFILPTEDLEPSLELTLDTRVSDLETDNARLLLTSVEQELKINSMEQDLADLMLLMSSVMEV